MKSIRHILVAVDFHAASMRALAYAARIARSVGAELTIIHAHDLDAHTYPPDLPPVGAR